MIRLGSLICVLVLVVGILGLTWFKVLSDTLEGHEMLSLLRLTLSLHDV